MRRKVLQDHAHTLCQMLVGWRMGEDVARFATLGSGRLEIDILHGKSSHNGEPVVGVYISEELRSWFAKRLEIHAIPIDMVLEAILRADLNVKDSRTKKGARRVTFEWRVNSHIRTDEAQYNGKLIESHTWAGAI